MAKTTARKKTAKKKATKKKLPEGWTPTSPPPVAGTGLGEITKDTPIGRRFEFDEVADHEALIYRGWVERKREMLLSFGVLSGPKSGDVITVSPRVWADTWAPHVTGYTDAPGGAPDALKEFVGKGQKAQAGVDQAAAEAGPGEERARQPAAETTADSMADTVALLARIRAQNEVKMEARKAWLALKEDAADARKTFDAASERLTDIIAEKPPDTPLFDAADEDWRKITLKELGLAGPICAALAANKPQKILTLGDLVGWQEKKGDFWHKAIKGLGMAAVEKIAEVCDAFWAKRKAREDA